MPRSGLDAKFSVQFLTVKALTSGRISLSDFDDARFMTPILQDLLPRVTSVGHQEADAYLGEVRVVLKDGRELSDKASTNFGRGPLNPMSDAELGEKFADCAEARLGAATPEIFAAFLALEAEKPLAPLMARLAVQEV